jgi:hypothetical protein
VGAKHIVQAAEGAIFHLASAFCSPSISLHSQTDMSDSIPAPALNQGAGYGVVIGLGAFFAIGMIFITNYLAKKGNVDDNEEFAVAKRSIGVGLTAAGVISSWTWSTTLLSSCGVAYQYGVAGFVHFAYNHAAFIGRGHRAFFYAACNSTQVSEIPFSGRSF